MKKHHRAIHIAAAFAAALSCASVTLATNTWIGGSSANSNWSTPANWLNGAVPLSANTTDIEFPNSPRTSVNDDLANPMTIRSLWFYDTPYTLSGSGLAFDGAFASIHNSTTASTSNNITFNADTSYEGAGDFTFANTISGPGGFIKNGSGTVNINFFTTFTGDTQVNAGQIFFGHTQALLTTTVHLNINNGLNLNGQAAVIGNITGTGSLSLGTSSITVGSNNSSQTYSGPITGAGGIEKRGSGAWTLSGIGSNFPGFTAGTGSTILSGGTLTLTSTAAGPTRALTVGNGTTASMTVEAGAVLNTVSTGVGTARLSGGNGLPGTLTITGIGTRWDAANIDIGSSSPNNPGGLTVDNSSVVNANAVSVGKPDSGSLVIQNSGVLNTAQLNVNSSAPVPALALRTGGQSTANLTTLATPTTIVDIDRATLTTAMLASNAGNGSITLRDPFTGSALVISGASSNATYAGSISGSGGITKNGASTQTLSGQNTYSGSTTVNNGILIMNSGASSAYNANGLGQLTLNFGNLGFSSLRVAGGGTIHYPPTVIGGFIRGSDGNHDLKDVVSFNGTTFAVDSVLAPSNPLTLNNVTNSGKLTSNSSLGWNGGVNSSAGTFTINSEASASVSSFENNGVIAIQRRAVLTNSDTNLVSGGGSRITIDSQGELVLNNKSELHLNGALLVNNGLIRGRTNVNFGSLAKGAGEYGEVNVTDGGKFSPGNSPGSVTTASTTWNSGGSYLVEIADALAGAGTGWDSWNINGALSLNATNTTNGQFTIALSTLDALAANFDNTRSYDWTILHADSGLIGMNLSELALDTSGFKNPLSAGHFILESTPNDLIIHFSNVPEPIFLALFASMSIFAAHRRRVHR
jgi:fibronectin-binding autotransporter adhesin